MRKMGEWVRYGVRAGQMFLADVLRLKFQLHLSDRQLARSCALARSTVAEYVRRAQRAGLTWPLPEEWDDRTIGHRLFPPTGKSPPGPRPLPDFATVHEERCRHKHASRVKTSGRDRPSAPIVPRSAMPLMFVGWDRRACESYLTRSG